ncbi:MAG: DUF2723 domain-containing protein [Caldilineales bacterium]
MNAPRVERTRADALLAAGLGLLAAALYAALAAPGILSGDSGELQFAAWRAGLAHPTGYPLYLTLGWLWTHALAAAHLAAPARAMTLLTALFGGLAVAFTALLARALTAHLAATRWSQLAALTAAVIFALTPTLLSQATITEVYTLHAAWLAATLWLAVRWRERQDAGLLPLAFVAGLGLAHHRTSLLLWPVLLLYLWPALRHTGQRSPRRLLLAVLLALAPLLFYLYIPLRAAATPYLTLTLGPGAPAALLDHSAAGLWRYALGQSFAGELQSPAAALRSLPTLLPRLSAELGWSGVLLAAAGVLALAVRRRWALLWLTAASFAVLAGFNLTYTIGDIAVFYISVYLIAVLWLACALAWLANAAASATRGPLPGLMILLPALLVLAPLLLHLPAANRRNDSHAEQAWRAHLAANPPRAAVLVTNDRDEMMPLWYLQQVEGLRPDLAGVFPLLLAEQGWLDIGQTVRSALATGRPVYLIKPMPGLEILAQLGETEPSGLTPVFGMATSDPPAQAVDALLGDTVRLLGYDEQRAGEQLTVALHWQAVRPLSADYTTFVQALAADGSKLAQSDHPAGGVYYPTSLWPSGEVLLDRHVLALPTGAAPAALLIGMYRLVDGELISLGTVQWEMRRQ